MDLTEDLIKEFFDSRELPKSGTKPEIETRLNNYLSEGIIKYEELVNYIDKIIPTWKQHVFLYTGPEEDLIDNWRNKEYCQGIFNDMALTPYLNSKLPLILPIKMTISSIEYTPEKELKIIAVKRVDHYRRKSELDELKKDDNSEVEFRAFVRQVSRGVLIFKWDLVSNEAALQILQLPKEFDYEQVEKEFIELVDPWLEFEKFFKINLRKLINKLHELEEKGKPEARSHGVKYYTPGGRAIIAQSPTPDDSIIGEPLVNDAMGNIRKYSQGFNGNFYWTPSRIATNSGNLLKKEVHTIINGDKNRINFTKACRKDDFEYVLSRMRALSK